MSDGQGSRSNGGVERGENMSDIRELKPEPVELKLINPRRTSLIPTETRRDPAPIRKKRNRAVRGWAILSGALMALCTIQWIAIYLMLPSVF